MKVLKVKKIDAYLDFTKLTTAQKLLLYPILVGIFGLLRATVLLYGGKR